MTDDASVGFVDILFVLLLAFVAQVILMIPHVNPPPTVPFIERPPHLAAEILWPPGNTDVDVWISGPDHKPVGYSSKSSPSVNLLRDDLGSPDLDTNWEIAITRDLKDGDYAVNVHMFRSVVSPLVVKVSIGVKRDGQAYREILSKTVTLTVVGEEITVYQFGLRGGTLIPGSVNSVSRPMRDAI